MKRSIAVLGVLCGLAWASLEATPAAADDTVRVAGATPSGEYITFARATCDELGTLFHCSALETEGSQDNVDRLKLGLTDPKAVDLAFVNGHLADQVQQESGFNDNFAFVRSVAGEAVLLIMTPETAAAVKNWAGVKDAAFLLSMGVPGEKSGATAVLTALRAIAGSPLQALEIKQYKGRPALIAAVQSGEVRSGWLVQYANPDNEVFRMINEAGLVMMGVVDPDFVQLGGSFGVQKVTVDNAHVWPPAAAKTVQTTTIKTAMLARAPKTYPDLRSQRIQEAAIRKIQQAPQTDILPKASWLTDLINAATVTTADAVGKLYNTMAGEAVGAKERVGRLGH